MNKKLKEITQKFVELSKNTTVRIISAVFVICLIASFFIFPGFYKAQWHKIQSYYYVYQGDKAYKKHMPQDAINNYEIALKLHPKHVRARYNLANLYVAYEDYYSALRNYELALELKPDFMIARIDYAIVLSEATFNYDKAIQEYETAIKKTPKWMYIPFIIDSKKTYSYNKGVAYYNQGLAWRGKSLLFGQDQYKTRSYLLNAIDSYTKSLESIKGYDVYYNLGIANQLLRKNYAAGRNYCLAIEKEPMNYEAHFNLAILLKTMQKYDESAQEFKKAGLLIGGSGDANKMRYIFDVLNEVNRQLALDPEWVKMAKQRDEAEVSNGKVAFVGGELVISEEFDKEMMKNFKTCANKEAFNKESEFDL